MYHVVQSGETLYSIGVRYGEGYVLRSPVALLDPLSEARLAAIWPLAWIRMPRAPLVLKRAYDTERDSEVKARLVQIAYNLMSPAGKSILEIALQSSDEHVRETARAIAHEHQLSL